MSAVAAYQTENMHLHRKPLPPTGVNPRLQTLQRIVPDTPQHQQQQYTSQYTPQQHQQQQQQQQQQQSSNRASTASSSGYSQMAPQYTSNNPVSYQAHMNAFQPTTKRSLSNATASTTSTTGGAPVARRTSASSSNLQRSASSRSGGGQPSYVQMMRKQKATVWSDRTPYEDPRVAQQQRAAKMRAVMEVSGATSSAARASTAGSSSLTGGIRSKVRHHGAPKATIYAPNTHPAIGVPVRLSANEVYEDDDENDDDGYKHFHHRSGSGRSSNGSGARNSSVYGLQPPLQSTGHSHSSTPGSNTQNPSPNQPSPASSQRRVQSQDLGGPEQPVGADSQPRPDYFSKTGGTGGEKYASPGANSGDSNSRENSFGDVGDLPHRTKPVASTEVDLAELRRRGSVDERTMTMSGYSKLFVANPDLE